jgi:hypothetical protein
MEGSDLYLLVVLMHYLVIFEVHCPNRVMCQFGLYQHILDDVDTLDDLHVINDQGKMDDNWCVVHV